MLKLELVSQLLRNCRALICKQQNEKPQYGKLGFIFNTSELTPPNTYTISCRSEEGRSGAAGRGGHALTLGGRT